MKGEFYSSEADLSSPRKEVLGESEEEREGRGGRRREASVLSAFSFPRKGSEFFQGGEDFRSRRVAFPRAMVLSTSPGKASELEGSQPFPCSSRSPVDRR